MINNIYLQRLIYKLKKQVERLENEPLQQIPLNTLDNILEDLKQLQEEVK